MLNICLCDRHGFRDRVRRDILKDRKTDAVFFADRQTVFRRLIVDIDITRRFGTASG